MNVNMLKKTKGKLRFVLPIILAILTPVVFVVLKNYRIQPKEVTQNLPTSEVTPTGTSIILPEHFPNDFPVAPGAKLVAAQSAKDKLEGVSAVWEAKESVGEIISFYKTNFAKDNWNYEVSAQGTNFATLKISKEGTGGFMGITQAKENVVVITVALGIQ